MPTPFLLSTVPLASSPFRFRCKEENLSLFSYFPGHLLASPGVALDISLLPMVNMILFADTICQLPLKFWEPPGCQSRDLPIKAEISPYQLRALARFFDTFPTKDYGPSISPHTAWLTLNSDIFSLIPLVPLTRAPTRFLGQVNNVTCWSFANNTPLVNTRKILDI